MKHIRKFYLLLGALLCLGLAACGSDDDGDVGGGGNSNPIVGTWRLSELKTDAWIDYTDGSESQHSISTKTYGMKNGVWENTYTFNGDGSYNTAIWMEVRYIRKQDISLSMEVKLRCLVRLTMFPSLAM